ncbi:MAG: tRNA (adenosine(37)-N6)-threonylcarbamoyltransferase complex ATPase subunit type 1 TsaE [Candidatus Levybacteria bacterium]|nr:tRNA (adenosine(37)-N6)-threonylcarbamoyltransferase complex ATPase subunit type 1 TsaE [Candidatus Levybacteria bacterium]
MKIKEKVFITKNSQETKKLGRDFAKTLKKGDVVCLYGDLGSGKTTFTQGLAEGLGIKEKIISPTFLIIRTYPPKNFYHVDLYRVANNNLQELGLQEILKDPSNITAIEWAQNLKEELPKKRIDIIFSHEKENTRRITFSLTT